MSPGAPADISISSAPDNRVAKAAAEPQPVQRSRRRGAHNGSKAAQQPVDGKAARRQQRKPEEASSEPAAATSEVAQPTEQGTAALPQQAQRGGERAARNRATRRRRGGATMDGSALLASGTEAEADLEQPQEATMQAATAEASSVQAQAQAERQAEPLRARAGADIRRPHAPARAASSPTALCQVRLPLRACCRYCRYHPCVAAQCLLTSRLHVPAPGCRAGAAACTLRPQAAASFWSALEAGGGSSTALGCGTCGTGGEGAGRVGD